MFLNSLYLFILTSSCLAMRPPAILYKYLGSSIIASTLITSNVENLQNIPKNHPIIKNDNKYESSSSILVERNNIYLYGDITPDSCKQ